MTRLNRDYPRQIVVRLTVEQDTYLREQASKAGVGVSDMLRAILESARDNDRVDAAIATIDRTLAEVEHAVRP